MVTIVEHQKTLPPPAFSFVATSDGSALEKLRPFLESGKVKGFALFIDQNAVAARKRHLGVGNAVPETADAWFAKA